MNRENVDIRCWTPRVNHVKCVKVYFMLDAVVEPKETINPWVQIFADDLSGCTYCLCVSFIRDDQYIVPSFVESLCQSNHCPLGAFMRLTICIRKRTDQTDLHRSNFLNRTVSVPAIYGVPDTQSPGP